VRSLSLLFFFLLALAAVPAVAGAQDPQVNAPPGNSGIDEYLETVPGAEGNRPARPGGVGNGPGKPGQPGSNGGGSRAVPPAVRRELERTAEGRKALALAESGAPSERAAGRTGAAGLQPSQAQDQAPGGGPLSAIAKSLTGSEGDGLGLGLPLLLLGSALTIGLLATLRRRRT